MADQIIQLSLSLSVQTVIAVFMPAKMATPITVRCSPACSKFNRNPEDGAQTLCNLYSITTNQAAIIALFRVINRYVGNLPPMPGVFPDYPAPVIRNTDTGSELAMMRWGMPPPPGV